MAAIPTSQKRPFIPAPGVVQVEMIYNYLLSTCENVYHVQMSSGGASPTAADMMAVAAAFENWESTQGRQWRNLNAVLTMIRVRDLTVQAGAVVERVPTSNVTGAGGGTALPGNVTAAVSWRTALGGRSFRGRSYHIGLQVTFTNANQLTAATQTGLAAAYTALLNAVNTTWASGLVVLSYAHNKFWRNTAVATPITSVSVDINLDSQRRRLTGRGK